MTKPVLSLAGEGLEQVLELARRHLGMDVAFVAEFSAGKQVYRALDGEVNSFGFVLGDGPPLEGTYCQRMIRGQIPNVVGDARAHPVTANLQITAEAGIGAYVGVPLRLSDGTLYGSFCCLSRDRAPVDAKDAKFLVLLADLLVADIEAERAHQIARRQIEQLLAMQHKGITIAFQPIVDIITGRLDGVEALGRFPIGYGTPDVVFAQAHQVGLGYPLERRAVDCALRASTWLGPHQYLSVNVSPDTAASFAAAAVKPDAPAMPLDRIVLEITEHAAVTCYKTLRESLAPARARGLRLAIDDAGAGYASLHHIVELAPDIIKIDRSLIAGMSTDRNRRSVCAALVALAADLRAHLVAEGVETPADLLTAHDLGITSAQGYLLARPTTDQAAARTWLHHGVPTPAISGHLASAQARSPELPAPRQPAAPARRDVRDAVAAVCRNPVDRPRRLPYR